jgi:hypothetical protein
MNDNCDRSSDSGVIHDSTNCEIVSIAPLTPSLHHCRTGLVYVITSVQDPDGTRVNIYDIMTGNVTWSVCCRKYCTEFYFSPASKYVVSIRCDEHGHMFAEVLCAESGELRHAIALEAPISHAKAYLSNMGNKLAVHKFDVAHYLRRQSSSVEVWDLDNGTGLCMLDEADLLRLQQLYFSGDDRHLIVVNGGHSLIQVFDVDSGAKCNSFHGMKSSSSICCSFDGRLCAQFSNKKGMVCIYELRTGDKLLQLEGAIRKCCFGPDCSSIIGLIGAYSAKAWNITDGTELFNISCGRDVGLGHELTCLDFCPATASFFVGQMCAGNGHRMLFHECDAITGEATTRHQVNDILYGVLHTTKEFGNILL